MTTTANGVCCRIDESADLDMWNTVETNIIGEGDVVTRFYSTENRPGPDERVRFLTRP